MGLITRDEQIEKLIEKYNAKIKQIKAQKQKLINKSKVQERKERTRRLIQVGALTEKYLGVNDLESTEKLLAALVELEDVKKFLVDTKKIY